MRQMQGGGKGGAFSFGKSKARMLDEASNTITFADVAGCDEANRITSYNVCYTKLLRSIELCTGLVASRRTG